MSQVNFDLVSLRSFVTGMDLGSFAKAAGKVGRSTSAISAQIKKLEEQAGMPLFRKAGRGLALTDAGETMLRYARRLVELNDEASAAVRGTDLEGWVRLGLQEDFGETLLPEVLGSFARAHPKVRVEARVARNVDLMARLDANELDLALIWDSTAASAYSRRADGRADRVARPALRWIGSKTLSWRVDSGEPLPLIAFDGPCVMYDAARAALDRAGIPWRVVFTSPSLAGLWAAASAGLGLTVRTLYGMPSTLIAFDAKAHGLPPLPQFSLMLLRGASAVTPPVERLAELMVESVRSFANPLDGEAA
ncbi:LysR family transcriptional regulator [Trinickia terrae]|uniref:LysR family transcriptional regulator n=1 Tax=Trinickia terrae TaxID=2571161 RepID=A0A4U1IFH6_9BURK|nr:LysR substrate-binding domain-containing protein [Trinickia terrae]TKC92483.1 LysR family transcriptional regulator [Trinickia terrae]